MAEIRTPHAIIRLQVEAMKHEIVQAVSLHHSEIEEEVGKAVDAAFREVDLTAMINEEIARAMRDIVASIARDQVEIMIIKKRRRVTEGLAEIVESVASGLEDDNAV